MDRKFDYQRYLASRQWALRQVAVRERADDTCERCLHAPIESIHHLTYERIGHETLEDLLGVCNPCHAWLSAKSDRDPVTPLLAEVRSSLSVYGYFASTHADCPGMCIYSQVEAAAAYYGVCHDPYSAPSAARYERLQSAANHYEAMLAL